MKNKFKILALVFMSILFLSGCAKVNYTILNGDSSITQVFSVKLDSTSLALKGISILDAKSIINSKLYDFNITYTQTFVDNINALVAARTYSSDDATKILEAVDVTLPIWNNHDVIYQIVFNSAILSDSVVSYENIYYLFYYGKLNPDFSGEENEIVTSGLTKTASQTEKTIFDSSVANLYKQAVISAFSEAGEEVTDSDIEYSFTYGTTFHRLHSNADVVEKSGDYYLHSWTLDSSNSEITLYRTYANQNIWYLIAIGVGALSVITFIIISKCKNRKKGHPQSDVEIILPSNK